MIRVSGVVWFTNLDIHKRHEDLFLYKTYHRNEDEYPKYDNYDAINVDKVKTSQRILKVSLVFQSRLLINITLINLKYWAMNMI